MQETTPTRHPVPLKQRTAAVRDGLKQRLADLRQRFWYLDTAVQAFERDVEVGGFVLAGAIAFRLFVYMLPMYLLVLVAAAAAFSVDPSGSQRFSSAAGMSGYIITMLSNATETSRKSMWILVPATLWALAVAGRSVFRVITVAHANAWRTQPKPTRASASLEVIVFALVCLAGTGTVRYARSQGLMIVAMVIAVGAYTGLWLLASFRLPHDPTASWIDLLPGAVLVSVGTQGLYLFYVLYLQHQVESASEAYGALGVAASGLAWLYMLGRLFVAAPVLNAVLHERRASSEPGGDSGEA